MDSMECSSFILNTCFEATQYKYSIFAPLIISLLLGGFSLFLLVDLKNNNFPQNKKADIVFPWTFSGAIASLPTIIFLLIFSEPLNFLVSLMAFSYFTVFLKNMFFSNPALDANKLFLFLKKDLSIFDTKPVSVAANTTGETSSGEEEEKVSFFEEFIMNKATLFFLCLLVFGIGLVVFK
jgi:hypothetical protein